MKSTNNALRIATYLLLIAGGACRRSAADYVKSADQYVAAEKYPEAIIEYRNALQKDPRAADVRLKLGDTLARVGDYAHALGEYARAADLRPADSDLQVRTGNLLLFANRFDDARARAQAVLAKHPEHVEAQILLANALAGLKDIDGAIAQVEDALKVDPDRSASYANLGSLELTRGDKDGAARAFRKAIELQPKSVMAHLAFGNFCWATSQWPQAEQAFKRALELDPRDTLANRTLANFYLATNRPRDAEGPLNALAEITKAPAAALTLAQYYIESGNEAEARRILDPMSATAGTAADASVLLATLDYRLGRRDTASVRLAAVLGKNPDHLSALLLKSNMAFADGKLDEALEITTNTSQHHPESSAAFFALGRIQARRHNVDAAVTAYQEVLRLNPRATDAKIALSELHLAKGRPDTSIVYAQEALTNQPANPNADLALIRGLLASGDLDRAQARIEPLAARFPDSAVVHSQMGMLLGRREQYAAARAQFERALQLQPDETEAFGGLVALDLAERKFAAASDRINARLAVKATPPLLALAARAQAASGNLAAAEPFLRRAIELDGSYLPAYTALGQSYFMQGKLAEAVREFEAVTRRSPGAVSAWTMLGIVHQRQGDLNAARVAYERALNIDPEAAVSANNLAWIYAHTDGNLEVAMQLAQTAKKRLPAVAEVDHTLGFVYYKKGFDALATSTLAASVAKDPNNPVAQYHLGLAYAKAGDVSRATRSLKQALAIKSDFEGAQDARDRLAALAEAKP